MKRILITGAGSYIGCAFAEYIKEHSSDEYIVDTLDMVDDGWREKSFAGYDAVFHVAGIAHQKETEENASLYYKVNRDLAIETAHKAKNDGVKQFIFLSSMSVYGRNTGVITPDTKPAPKSNYGKSKLQAEEGISTLSDDTFKVCVLRPPMVYGLGCKGNYQSIVKIVKKLPFFPRIKNKRSMIYIDNLSSFVKMCIDKELCGLYFPQNREYVRTSDMAKSIAEKWNKRLYLSRLLGLAVLLLRVCVPMAKKAFGTLIYEDTELHNFEYCVVSNKDSFERSVFDAR